MSGGTHALTGGFTACVALAAAWASSANGATNAPLAGVSFDRLMGSLQTYGNTGERRQEKAAARVEWERRGPEALRYLVAQAHVKNTWMRILLEQTVEKLKPDEAAPVLAAFLAVERMEVRKAAAYYLGWYDVPAYAEQVAPLLADRETAGAAMRTLGKWKQTAYLPRIVPYLSDDDERRRIAAANALHDMRDPRGVPALVPVLGDPVFTVRQAAGRALAVLGPDAERALLQGLETATRQALRERCAVLAKLKSVRAVRPLRSLLRHADPAVRADAARALLVLAPGDAMRWIAASPASGSVTASGGVTLR